MTDQADTDLATLDDAADNLLADENDTPVTGASETPAEQEPATGEGEPSAEADADEEVIVSIGDEAPPASEDDENRAPAWVKDLRKANREKDRKLREQEAEIARLKGGNVQEQAVIVGAKPTLESCDFDAEKFETDLEAWHERKRQAASKEAEKAEAERKASEAWQARLSTYSQAAAKLKVSDFKDAEDAVADILTVTQQGVILSGADKPELLIYALGKAPKKAKELAAITDPVKFAFAVAKLETQLKVTPRNKPPTPERRISGAVSVAAGTDQQLEKLREEARKTGDMSKVNAFNRDLRRRQGT